MDNFQIAIHDRKGSFSDRWIEYCQEKGLFYKIVNCYDLDIMSQLATADALLWHWHQEIPEDVLVARHIIRAAESMGLKVFPDTPTCWSYDDKVAQKYLLEAIGAPLAPTYVFYDRRSALRWVERTSFPKVFKLGKGAGSLNVRLAHTAREARMLVKRAFGKGFKPVGGHVRDIVGKFRWAEGRKRLDLPGKVKRLPRSLWAIYRVNKTLGSESGYIYFQDFIPNNKYDTRITVIGNRAFGLTRNVREKDFRASGSGSIDYSLERINPKCISIAFDVAKKLNTQSIAFDFVIDVSGEPKITEVSYCYVGVAVYRCEGHWDDQLKWHEGHTWPQDAILIDVLEQLRQTKEPSSQSGCNR